MKKTMFIFSLCNIIIQTLENTNEVRVYDNVWLHAYKVNCIYVQFEDKLHEHMHWVSLMIGNALNWMNPINEEEDSENEHVPTQLASYYC